MKASPLSDAQVTDEQINTVQREIKVKVAMDSGAVSSVTHPITIPDDTSIAPNNTGKHFVGAGGETIEKFGTCLTLLEGEAGVVG